MQSTKSICECQKQFMQDQIHEIEVFKWLESELAGYDLGQTAVRKWIDANAKDFRTKWFTKNQNL